MRQFSIFPRTPQEQVDLIEEERELDDFLGKQNPVNLQAVDWHNRIEQGLNSTEEAEFDAWMASDPINADAFAKIEQTVVALRSIAPENFTQMKVGHPSTEREKLLGTDEQSKTTNRPNIGSSLVPLIKPRSWLKGLVACCLALIAVSVAWYQWQQPDVFTRDYIALRGEQKTVILPDGSQLFLDAETKAKVIFSRDHREVRMSEGQIMFSVAHDSRKPFNVLAGSVRVAVVGTRFSVRHRKNGMDAQKVKIAVEEGHVRLFNIAKEKSTNKKSSEVDLLAGQGLTVSDNGEIGKVLAIMPGSVAPWKKGLVRFENTPLRDALIEMERYGSTGLIIRDSNVATMPIGGSFKADSPENFAAMITKILPVKIAKDSTGKSVIIKAP